MVNNIQKANRYKVPLVASLITSDYNNMDEAITYPFSLFRIGHHILWPITLLCFIDSVRVTIKYYRLNNKSLPLNYCSCSLLITILANIFRIPRAIDVCGVRLGYFVATLSTICCTTVLIVRYPNTAHVYVAFTVSRNNRFLLWPTFVHPPRWPWHHQLTVHLYLLVASL